MVDDEKDILFMQIFGALENSTLHHHTFISQPKHHKPTPQ
jgi:hypothetical protein